MTSLIEAVARAIDPLAWEWLEEGGTGHGLFWIKRREKSLSTADAAISALQESGHVVVPVEPTDEMIDAALGQENVGSQMAGLGDHDIEEAYRAMLKASQGDE